MCGYFYPSAGGAVASAVVKQLYVRRMKKLIMIKTERIDRVELMRTFVRIVEAGSLSAAAKQIGTTQATVSRRLQSLETLLGVKLLMRTTHAMKLTDDGERGYQHAKKIIDAGWRWKMDLMSQKMNRWGRCESAHRMRSGNNNYLSRFCSFFRAIPSWQ